ARLQNELALVQVQLDEHAATGQQLRKSLDFERRANAELSQALESANSAAQAAAAQPDEVRELTNELDSARRKVLQLRDLIGRQTRELEGHARARREAEERAESVRAELARKSQVLIEMKRYLRHLGRRVSGLRTGAATAARRANHNRPTATANSRSQINAESASIIDDEYDEDGEDCGWEDVPTDDCGDGRTAAHKDFDDASVDGLEDVDERQLRQPDSGRSLGRAIANRAKSQGDAHRPMFVARLQARTGALQQQLLQCRRARQKASAERDRLAGESVLYNALQCFLLPYKNSNNRPRTPGYHSEGPTAEDYLTKSDESTSAAAAATAELSDSLARCRQAKSRAERELRVAKDTIDELRRRVREAEAAAASERTAAEKAKTKAGTLKETVRRIQSQLDSARSAATSAGEQRRRFEQLWQESRAELDQARSRARSSAVDSERRRRQIDEASNRAQASEAAAREELLRCENRLSLAERLLGQIARLVEAKSESTRLLVSTHCDRVEALPPPLPPQQQQPVGPTESEVHQLRARQRAASILNLSDGELDSLLMASGSPQQQQQQPTKTKLAELRTAMGSRETDKQWANQCMRLAQAVKAYNSSPNTSSPAELDQLLDKFTEKLDDFVNTLLRHLMQLLAHTHAVMAIGHSLQPAIQQAIQAAGDGPRRVIVSAVQHGSFTQSQPLLTAALVATTATPSAAGEQQGIVGDHRGVVTGGAAPAAVGQRLVEGVPLGRAVGLLELRRPPAVKEAALAKVVGPGGGEVGPVTLVLSEVAGLRGRTKGFVRQLRIWEAGPQLRIWEAGGPATEDLGGRQQQLRIWEAGSSN
uniref:RING-type domain-containing protein n=1 Tax=Macrostomum lignano TaxID=282301 RepID=A0A1I8FSE3_9PLAT